MIRINLLPVRQTQKRQTIQQQVLAGLGLIVATLIACVVWTAAVASQVDEKLAQIDQKKNELRQLEKIIGEVDEFTKKKKELEDKLEVIESLRKGKTGPVRALDDLATDIPNRVWLSRVEESAGSMTIEGLAVDHEDVSAFMKALQKSKYYSDITLNYSRASTSRQGGAVLYDFKITCRVNYSA